MRFIGRREGVHPELVEQMEWAEAKTAANDRITLFVAFNYGGRAEIVDAAARYEGGGEEAFRAAALRAGDARSGPVIRTSGEQRLSNYLLWQSAYSELHFTDVLWPDFSRADLEAALERVTSARAPALRRALMAARSRCQPGGARASAAASRTCSRASSSRSRRSRSRSSSSPPAAGSSRSASLALGAALPARAVPHVRARAARSSWPASRR